MNQSYAARFADLIEGIAGKARALTVDRLAKAITITTFGLGAAVLMLLAMVLLCVALFRLLEAGVGATAAYAISGGLFLVAGWLSWRRAMQPPEETNA